MSRIDVPTVIATALVVMVFAYVLRTYGAKVPVVGPTLKAVAS